MRKRVLAAIGLTRLPEAWQPMADDERPGAIRAIVDSCFALDGQ
jgi:hypothetical protein